MWAWSIISSISRLSPLLPSLEKGVGQALKILTSNYDLVFLATSPHPGAPQSHLTETQDGPRALTT